MNLLDFVNGSTYLSLLAVFLVLVVIREVIKWLIETGRVHIAITMVVTLVILAIGVPLYSVASGGIHDEQLTMLVETILFGFSLWIYFGGNEPRDEPGVSRKRFFDRRVKSVKGFSAKMSDQAAKRRRERARHSRVTRKPFYWNAVQKIFGRKKDDFFNW